MPPSTPLILKRISDRVVSADTARQLHAEVVRAHALAAWIVMRDQPAYSGKFVARFVTTKPTPYVLLADSLMTLRESLPRGLNYAGPKLVDLRSVVEIWFAPEGASRDGVPTLGSMHDDLSFKGTVIGRQRSLVLPS